jgi:hypothetical protein
MKKKGTRARTRDKFRLVSCKRSVSEVVAMVLIVLIVLAAIILVWNLVSRMVETGAGSSISDKLSVSLSAKLMSNITDNPIAISVSRSAGQGNISRVMIILKNSTGQSWTYENTTVPGELETIIYYINITGHISNPISFEVYPIFLNNGKETIGVLADIKGGIGEVSYYEPNITMVINITVTCYADNDFDGYFNGTIKNFTNFCPFGYINSSQLKNNLIDCNDINSEIHPNAIESCSDNEDNNCDGVINNGCYLDPLWIRLNGGNSIGAYEGIGMPMVGGYIGSLSTSEGLIYYFTSETLDLIIGRLSNDKQWELLTESGWNSQASVFPIQLSVSDKVYPAKLVQFPDKSIFSFYFGFVRLSRVIFDFHGEAFSAILNGTNWARWNGGISYSKYGEKAILPNYYSGSTSYDFAFNGNNSGIMISSYTFSNGVKLAAARFNRTDSSSLWKNWNGTGPVWNTGNPSPIFNSNLSISNPKIEYLGDNIYLAVFRLSSSNQLGAAMYSDSSNTWKWWNTTGWQQGGDYNFSGVSNGIYASPQAIVKIQDNISVFSSYAAYLNDPLGSSVYETRYNSINNNWTTQQIVGDAKYQSLSAVKGNNNDIWLVYINNSDSIKLLKKASNWTVPVEIFRGHNINAVNINFFNNSPVIFYEEDYKIYALGNNSLEMWNNEQPVSRTKRPELNLDESRIVYIGNWSGFINGTPQSTPASTSASLDMDSEGRLYELSTGNSQLGIFNSSTLSPLNFWGGFWDYFWFPSSAAVDNVRNKVYVADYLTTGSGGYLYGRVQIFNKSYVNQSLWYKWNGPTQIYPPAKTGFLFPADLAVDEANGYLYVSDTMNSKVQQFNLSNVVSELPVKIKDIGSDGSGNSQFKFPEGIDTDEAGNLYVVDTLNHRLQKFDKNGNFLLSFGSQGFGNGQFIYPLAISVDKNYNLIYTTDPYKKQIQIFDKNGNFIYGFGKWTGGEFGSFGGIVGDGKGNIFISSDNRIYKFSIVNPNVDLDGDKIPDSLE